MRISKKEVELFGLPQPEAVRDSWLIIALATIGGLPFGTIAVILADSHGLLSLLQRLSRGFISRDAAVFLVFFAPVVALAGPVLFWIASSASRFLVRSVKTHLEGGHPDKAARVLAAFSHALLFREWKRNPWLREFAMAQGVTDRSSRLRGFANRLGAS